VEQPKKNEGKVSKKKNLGRRYYVGGTRSPSRERQGGRINGGEGKKGIEVEREKGEAGGEREVDRSKPRERRKSKIKERGGKRREKKK